LLFHHQRSNKNLCANLVLCSFCCFCNEVLFVCFTSSMFVSKFIIIGSVKLIFTVNLMKQIKFIWLFVLVSHRFPPPEVIIFEELSDTSCGHIFQLGFKL
jgi:hypothetical protein